jgi:Na+/phosphate symporter
MMSIIIGLITISLGIAGMAIKWWGEVTGFQLFLKAFIAIMPILLIIGGLIAIVAGISGLKDKSEESEKK